MSQAWTLRGIAAPTAMNPPMNAPATAPPSAAATSAPALSPCQIERDREADEDRSDDGSQDEAADHATLEPPDGPLVGASPPARADLHRLGEQVHVVGGHAGELEAS